MVFVLDLVGTLVQNVGGATEDECVEAIRRLREAGHIVMIWSASMDVPEMWQQMVNRTIRKPSFLHDWVNTVVIDDDDLLLSSCRRHGATVYNASEFPACLREYLV